LIPLDNGPGGAETWEIICRKDLILNTGYLSVKLLRLYVKELAST
jgi:hypothetical protein